MTYLLCVAILVDPINRAVNFVRLWQEGLTGFDRFMDMLEIAPDIRDRPGARTLARTCAAPSRCVTSPSAIRRVPRPVLRDLSLEIGAGEFVALIGYSGVGKTTLCSLIPRFYEASQGAGAGRRRRREGHHAGVASAQHRRGAAGRLPVRRHGGRKPRLRPAGRQPRRDRRGGPPRPTRTTSSWRCRRATTPTSASAASSSPAARSSG